jgi:hypothetical protein
MLDVTAILPLADITERMNHIRLNIPTGLGLEVLVDFVDYFYATSVYRISQTPSASSRQTRDSATAQSSNESGNSSFASFVGHHRPSL